MRIRRFYISYIRLKPQLVATTLVTLLVLHVYFILSLLSYKPQGKKLRGKAHEQQLRFRNTSVGWNNDPLDHDYDVLNSRRATHHHLQAVNFTMYSKNCQVLAPKLSIQTEWNTPFKIFIYDLPGGLNSRLLECVSKFAKTEACFRADYCGYGPQLSEDQGLFLHGTWQFNLEVIIHHKLLFSPYRTLDAAQADIFYVPYYSAFACFCYGNKDRMYLLRRNMNKLTDFLQQFPYLKANKPHLMTIGKIEREHFGKTCPLLKVLNTTNFHIIGLETEAGMGLRQHYSNYSKPLIVAPYPSYGHYDSRNTYHNHYVSGLAHRDRTVYTFLAAGERRSNYFRASIFDNLLSRPNTYKTKYNYEDFLKKMTAKDSDFRHRLDQQGGMLESVWLTTPECRDKHHTFTLDWMQRSIFCLQPPGDSPTRKSFYDAIISGCIPVLFEQKNKIKYPFERSLDYSQFTVSIDEDSIKRHKLPIATILSRFSPSKIKQLQISVAKVSKHLQYSFPIIANQKHDDALHYILEEIQGLLNYKW